MGFVDGVGLSILTGASIVLGIMTFLIGIMTFLMLFCCIRATSACPSARFTLDVRLARLGRSDVTLLPRKKLLLGGAADVAEMWLAMAFFKLLRRISSMVRPLPMVRLLFGKASSSDSSEES